MPIWFRKRPTPSPRPQPPPPPPSISPRLRHTASLKAEGRNEQFGVIYLREAGMMTEMECYPLEPGFLDYKCFELQHFWQLSGGRDGPTELYIARHETWTDAQGRARVKLLGFRENSEPDMDEYGVLTHHPEEDYIPKIDPFEERKRSKRNREVIRQHLNLILEEDV